MTTTTTTSKSSKASKVITNKAAKVEATAPVKANLSVEELMAKAQEEFAKKFPEPTTVLAKTIAKKEATAPLINSNDVRMSNKEIIDQAKAKEQAKEVKAKPTTKPANKPIAKPKEVKAPMITRIQCVGIIIKANSDATKEVICNKADTLFIKMTGMASNSKETETQYSKALNFLKGYNSK